MKVIGMASYLIFSFILLNRIFMTISQLQQNIISPLLVAFGVLNALYGHFILKED